MAEILEVLFIIGVWVVLLGLPLGLLGWFAVCLVKFKKAPKDNPGYRQKRKRRLIVSAVLAGFVVCSVLALMIIFMMAVAHM